MSQVFLLLRCSHALLTGLDATRCCVRVVHVTGVSIVAGVQSRVRASLGNLLPECSFGANAVSKLIQQGPLQFFKSLDVPLDLPDILLLLVLNEGDLAAHVLSICAA